MDLAYKIFAYIHWKTREVAATIICKSKLKRSSSEAGL